MKKDKREEEKSAPVAVPTIREAKWEAILHRLRIMELTALQQARDCRDIICMIEKETGQSYSPPQKGLTERELAEVSRKARLRRQKQMLKNK